jgi:hypothetical protein
MYNHPNMDSGGAARFARPVRVGASDSYRAEPRSTVIFFARLG